MDIFRGDGQLIIIKILKSRKMLFKKTDGANMFRYRYKRTHNYFCDYGNVVSKKKVDKMKEFYKRNRYRQVRRSFQEWKAKDGKEMNLFGQKKELQMEKKQLKKSF